MLVVPMRHERRIIGVIVLGPDRARGKFDQNDLRLLQIIADQAAIGIENARLLAGRDRLVHELEALLDISQATQLAQDEPTLAGVPGLEAGQRAATCRRLRRLAPRRGLHAAANTGRASASAAWTGRMTCTTTR